MRSLLALLGLALLTACGSGGPPPPDWKSDSADLIERYQNHALLGENTLAERYFQQAVGATGGAGRVAETARLWLVRCATRRAMVIDDACAEYAELAPTMRCCRWQPRPLLQKAGNGPCWCISSSRKSARPSVRMRPRWPPSRRASVWSSSPFQLPHKQVRSPNQLFDKKLGVA
jgi:hypothetical protein